VGRTRADDVSVSLQDLGQGAYSVEGQFHVTAASSTIWSVLADYDHIAEFVSSMEKSRIKEQDDGKLLVEQKAAGHFFFVERAVSLLLEIQETPFTQIVFVDVLHKDFDHYGGSWTIERDGASSTVLYRLTARPLFSVPGFIKKRVFKHSAKDLLIQVRQEILRRGMAAQAG
jgi:ribosome-associated toxin RatA of RatAB toxin-antitoxin module